MKAEAERGTGRKKETGRAVEKGAAHLPALLPTLGSRPARAAPLPTLHNGNFQFLGLVLPCWLWDSYLGNQRGEAKRTTEIVLVTLDFLAT